MLSAAERKQQRIEQAAIAAEQNEAERLVQMVAITAPAWVHQGFTMQPDIHTPEGLVVQPVVFPTAQVGAQRVEVHFVHKRGRVSVPVEYVVHAPTFDPRFPLEVGNQWRYQKSRYSRTRKGTLLWVIPLHKRSSSVVDANFLQIDIQAKHQHPHYVCLLYTSDAADE